MNSDEISHKLTFAKLFKPYDWVVATGVHLDDVDQLIMNETRKMEKSHNRQKLLSFSIAIIAVLISIQIMVIFEKQIRKLIISYEDEIEEYTNCLEDLSLTDRLTGLNNRIKLDNVFMYEIQKAQRYNNIFSILLLDLDNFKSVNDTCGHQVGDQVLQETAKVFEANFRCTDIVGRWGGEEFLIICPETKLEDAKLLAEKIRKTFEIHDFPVVGCVTCSFGISTYREGDNKESLINRADKALYCAKKNGRNKVCCEGSLV